MDDEVDRQAAEQIEQLFHATDTLVWEYVGSPARKYQHDVPIHRGDGRVIGFARPADETSTVEMPYGPLPVPPPALTPMYIITSSSMLLAAVTLITFMLHLT